MSNNEEQMTNDDLQDAQMAQPNADSQTGLDQKDAMIADLTDKWKRTAADFENFKRRQLAERQDLFKASKEIVVTELLPTLQSLEQVLKFAPNDEKYKDWLLGLKATIMQLEKTMEDLGLVKIKTVGLPFDPSLHEAVEEQESDSESIIQEVQPGFTLNGKLIIPAKVVVGKKKGE